MNTTTQKHFRTLNLAIGILLMGLAIITVTFTAKPAMAQAREIPGYVQLHLNTVLKDAAAEGDGIRAWNMDLKSIVNLLNDKNHRVASSAAYALGEIRDNEAVPALVLALKDDCRHMRRIAAHALGKIGDKRAVKPLIEALKNKTQPLAVQASIITSLGKIGDPEARRILTRLNRSPQAWLQQAADVALLKINAKQSFKVAAAE